MLTAEKSLAGDDGSGDARDWDRYNDEFKGIADRVIGDYVNEGMKEFFASREAGRLATAGPLGRRSEFHQQVYEGPEYFLG